MRMPARSDNYQEAPVPSRVGRPAAFGEVERIRRVRRASGHPPKLILGDRPAYAVSAAMRAPLL
ncbi:MAG: hypothetical protein JO223_11535 [Hyphomicrobiales bacterium]|nr:hypothetical protein [Hyphomicrobiales bacterium]MBV8440382.1 hypothetical protein [Hyphomicrobiales bacterium]